MVQQIIISGRYARLLQNLAAQAQVLAQAQAMKTEDAQAIAAAGRPRDQKAG